MGSNAPLQAQIAKLEKELSAAQNRNKALHSQINRLQTSLHTAGQRLKSYDFHIEKTLSACYQSILESGATIAESLELQNETDNLYAHFKNIEIANKNIRSLTADLHKDFDHYITIRKLVKGLVDNFDFALVSDHITSKRIQKEQLLSPDFYLTAVLLSIMAWKKNDRRQAEKHIQNALALAPKDTALFYIFFNMGVSRFQTALHWFNLFISFDLKSGDHESLLMLFSLSSRRPSCTEERDLYDHVIAYRNRLAAAEKGPQQSGELVDFCLGHLQAMEQPRAFGYLLLRDHCAEYPVMEKMLLKAANNINIFEFFYREFTGAKRSEEHFLYTYIDALISKPNPKELHIYDNIRLHELVIAHEGNTAEAKQQFDSEQQQMEQPLNITSHMLSLIYASEPSDNWGYLKKKLLSMTKEYHQAALRAYAKEYRAQKPEKLTITIDDYTTSAQPEMSDIEAQKVTAYFNEIRDEQLSAVKYTGSIIALVVAVNFAVLGFFLTPYLYVPASLSLLLTAFLFLRKKFIKKNIITNISLTQSSTLDTLNAVFREYQRFMDEYEEYDAVLDNIEQALT